MRRTPGAIHDEEAAGMEAAACEQSFDAVADLAPSASGSNLLKRGQSRSDR